MKLRTHIWTSALTALAIYPRRPGPALAVVLSGVLIDVDHYILYALKSGDWSLYGALRYNAYRAKPRRKGDTRPRYGSLRSVAHHPAVGLALSLFAARLPWLRPLAIGVALHQALDWHHIVLEIPVRHAAGWRCQLCGSRRRLHVHMIVHRRDGGRNIRENQAVLCERCWRAAQESYPVFPPLGNR